MEKLEHEFWIVQAVNAALGPMVAALLRALGRPVPPGAQPIPDYLVMAAIVVVAWTVVCLIVRRNLSVEHPGRVQILLEDGLRAVQAMMHDYVGHKGLGRYLLHFAAPPGAPLFIAPIMLPIEIISHLSRVLSLSLRLFGNIFAEDLVILILFSIVPFLVPLPMMFLGIITALLQSYIFVLLTTIYLGGAVATEHGEHDHGEMVAGSV